MRKPQSIIYPCLVIKNLRSMRLVVVGYHTVRNTEKIGNTRETNSGTNVNT